MPPPPLLGWHQLLMSHRVLFHIATVEFNVEPHTPIKGVPHDSDSKDFSYYNDHPLCPEDHGKVPIKDVLLPVLQDVCDTIR